MRLPALCQRPFQTKLGGGLPPVAGAGAAAGGGAAAGAAAGGAGGAAGGAGGKPRLEVMLPRRRIVPFLELP